MAHPSFQRTRLLCVIGLAALGLMTGQGADWVEDAGFERGFRLLEPGPGKRVERGILAMPGVADAPVWEVAQWNSRHPLDGGEVRPLGAGWGVTNMSRGMRWGTGAEAGVVELWVDSRSEYPEGPRRGTGEPWTHLLLEQALSRERVAPLTQVGRIRLRMEARLTEAETFRPEGYSADLHAAQFQVVLTLADTDPRSPGYGDFLWFVVPLYDDRHPVPPRYVAQDFAETRGKMIYNPGAAAVGLAGMRKGEWVTLDVDVRPHVWDAMEEAWRRGYLARSRDPGAFRLTSINLGWEVPGINRVGMEVRGLHLEADSALPVSGEEAGAEAKLLSVRKIWDAAPHNAFTDLVRWREAWWCAFREGAGHVSPDGALRILTSRDGRDWVSSARVTLDGADLRDAKMSVTPQGQLMLNGAAAWRGQGPVRHLSYAWFSGDGKEWSEPSALADPDVWLWRVTWHRGTAWSLGYSTTDERWVRWYSSTDGRRFEGARDREPVEGYANEHALVFTPEGQAVCLLRRDGMPGRALVGTAQAPYETWVWRELDRAIGGPSLLRLPDGRWVAGVRLYDGRVRTSLAWLDVEQGTLREFLILPSGGDTSYPGLVWHEDRLWVSYYASHEGKSSIYLATVALAP